MTAPIVIVGAGLAGAAAAWRLAAGGREVVLVEAATPAHAGGSSHGSARIFRHAYPDPFYVGLAKRAHRGWDELEAESGRSILTMTGGLDFGVGRDLRRGRCRRSRRTASTPSCSTPPRRTSAGRTSRSTRPVLHHAEAGVIDAAVAVDTMVAPAQLHGAALLLGDRVVGVEATIDGAIVHLEQGHALPASVVVIAAGGWLPELAPALPGRHRGAAARSSRSPSSRSSTSRSPRCRSTRPTGRSSSRGDPMSIYSLPGGRDAGGAGFKIAEHDLGTPTTASARDGVVDPAIARADRRLRAAASCRPSTRRRTRRRPASTRGRANEDFIIDRVGPVVIASPCSGHGAKFAPVLGELIANAATGGDGVPDRFRLAAHAQA